MVPNPIVYIRPECSVHNKKEELPKRENYEDEDSWREDIWEYFADKVVITDEEYEAYMRFKSTLPGSIDPLK